VASNNNGRLVTVADGGGSESYTYDLMGRITQGSKVINGNTYNVGYGYNTAGQLNSLTYPSGHVVNQSFDGVGRLSQILAAGQPPYLSVASNDYSAAGQVKHLLYGNGVQGDFTYNDHLQVSTLRYYVPGGSEVLNLGYDYGTQNNGQIQAVRYYLSPGVEDATASEYFTYDAWGRLKAGHTGIVDARIWTWSLQWDYDRFGNRRNQTLVGGGAAITQPQLTISGTTNRITDAGYAYDAAGNMTNDSLHTYAYDAENRTKTVDSTAATYTYLGALRVKKVVGATTTVYVFSGSKVLAEYANGALSKEYVYAGSQMLTSIAANGTVTYHHPDHLSDRAQTDSAGGLLLWQGHYPFGETWYESAPSGKWQFTSYERDAESGVDYAIFRNYSSRLGRFTAADLLGGNIFSPQSLNRYTYVIGDPINFVDPLGLHWECVSHTIGGVESPPICKWVPDGVVPEGFFDAPPLLTTDSPPLLIYPVHDRLGLRCIPRAVLPWNVRLGLDAMSLASKATGVSYFLGLHGSAAKTKIVGASYGFSGVWATDPKGNQALVYSLTGGATIGTPGASIGLQLGAATYQDLKGFGDFSFGGEASGGNVLNVGGGFSTNSSGAATFANISIATPGKALDISPKATSYGVLIVPICPK